MAPLPSLITDNSRLADTNTINNLDQKYLTDCKSLYICIYCRTHLANHDELVSRSFQGNHGRAYLFNSVVNVSCGPAVSRELNTGSHAVADIYCSNCRTTLGWKYEKAFVEAQRYKEGKYIIELAHVVRENKHLELDRRDLFLGRKNLRPGCKSDSLSPTSPSLLSSPASSSNEEFNDEDLMFPFYDDSDAIRSNFSGAISSSHRNRMRRSLYPDSTPYDWKQFATSPTEKQFAQLTSAVLLEPSNPPLSSSNQTETFPDEQEDHPNGQRDDHTDRCGDDNETQFELENDPIRRYKDFGDETSREPACSGDIISGNQATTNIGSSFDRATLRPDNHQPTASPPSEELSRIRFMDLDEDEFYDCFTDHEIFNSTISSKSINNLDEKMLRPDSLGE